MRFFTFFLFLIFTTSNFAQQAEAFSKHHLIDSLLQESYRRGIFNGNALVAVNGEIVYQKAIGYADASKNTLLNNELRFNIGSISKEFDGLGIMILKEEGVLSLDDSLSTYFPDLPKWADRVKVKHLLQYTSGIPAPSYDNIRTDAEVWEYLQDLKELKFTPGSDYDYNNANVYLRKRIIEKASGMSYSDFVQEKMLKPCGMKNSVIDPNTNTPQFTRSFDENFVEDDLDTYMSGWVALNTEDMYKWVQCLNSNKLIKQESLEELSQSFKPSSQSPLGLSAFDNGELQFRYHHGQNDNFEAGVAWIPDPGHTIILLTNNRCNELGDHINAIDAILRGQDFSIPKRSIELSLRAKIFHNGYDAGIKFLKEIRDHQADVFNFGQEEKELINTGTWLFEKGKNEAGLKILKLTGKKFPKSSRANLELAKTYEKTGKNKLAIDYYQKVAEQNPENKMATAKLAELQ